MKVLLSLMFILFCSEVKSQQYDGPESVEFDQANNRWLIGNTGSNEVLARDSAGTLSVFASGLGTGPYGIEIVGDTLFCCCGNTIKGYLLSDGSEVFNVGVNASFLNGLTHDNAGNLIATDFSAKRILKISIAAQTDTLLTAALPQTPNGIVFDEANNRCVFVNWGGNAPVKAIDMTTYQVTTLTSTTLGSCDGITRDGEGRYYISTWGAQNVVRYDSSFSAPPVVVASSLSSPADIFYDITNNVLAIPNSGNDIVQFLDFNTVGLNEMNQQINSSIFPNPAFSSATVISSGKFLSSFKVFSYEGKEVNVKILSAEEGKITFDVNELPAGNYFYRGESGKDAVSGTFRVLKK